MDQRCNHLQRDEDSQIINHLRQELSPSFPRRDHFQGDRLLREEPRVRLAPHLRAPREPNLTKQRLFRGALIQHPLPHRVLQAEVRKPEKSRVLGASRRVHVHPISDRAERLPLIDPRQAHKQRHVLQYEHGVNEFGYSASQDL